MSWPASFQKVSGRLELPCPGTKVVFYFTPDSSNGQSKEEPNSTCIRSSAHPRTVVVTCLSARRLDQVGDATSTGISGQNPCQVLRPANGPGLFLKNEQRLFFFLDRPGGGSDSRFPRNLVRNEYKAQLKLVINC